MNDSSTQRILIVEDSPAQAQAFAVMLEETGLKTETATSAEAAIERLAAETFHLVVTDLTLPGHSGIELCRRLKRGDQPVQIPVVVLTASGDVINVLRSLEAGADGFISKDRDAGEIVNQIRGTLERGVSKTATIRRSVKVQGQQFDFEVHPDQLFDVMLAAFDDLTEIGTQHAELNQQLEHELARRRQIEKDLRDSEAVYHSLVENVPVNLFRKDLEGRFTFANEPFCKELGVTSSEIIGKTDYDFFPKELAEKYRENDRQVIESRNVFEDVEAHETPDGQKMWVQVLKAPVFNSEGEITSVQCVFWDVTAREQAERDLRGSEARKQAIFEASLDCMVITDQDGKIIEFNRTSEKTFGYQRDEVLGQVMDELLFAPETRNRTRGNIEAYGSTREEGSILGKRVEVPLVRKNGENFMAELAMQPIPMDDTIHFATVLHDITRRKEAEQELQQAKEDAVAANKAKSDFLANMSHEIRTPMNAIIGMTELVLDTKLSAEQRDHLIIVQDSAESLLDLINDILDFSKIEAGKLDLDDHPFAIRDRLEDTMKSMAVRAHQKDLELACRIDAKVPATVVGDDGRLRQVVVNLVGNAIKFTESGEVVLDAHVESSGDDQVVLHFAVTDTGVGIPKHKLQDIFGAFEQVDTSTTRRFGGTGLGLAISSLLVRLMNGRIWVESEDGRGSTFHFTATFKLADASVLAKGVQPPSSVIGMHVLVVDDNKTNRLILEEMLANWGFKTSSATNGDEALSVLNAAHEKGNTFDVAVCDVNMPVMDGFGFVEQVRSNSALRQLPLIMLTSADRPGDVQRFRDLGVSRYLTKPAKQSELLRAIEAAVGITIWQPASEVKPATHGQSVRSLKILLAEDSMTNQKLAIALLNKVGHSVTVANNGQEAIDRFESEKFDLILMDVQMPEVDGFEATQHIRRFEQASGTHIPIIAMTAHAMKGDRERCLDAGMDSYIPKPIQTQLLFETLASIGLDNSERGIPDSTEYNGGVLASESDGLVDWNAALNAVGGHREVLDSVIEAVQDEVPGLLEQLEVAIAQSDFPVVRRAAHTIKGTMRTFEVTSILELAQELEDMGFQESLNNPDQLFSKLRTQLECTLVELQSDRPSESVFDD